MAENGYDRAVVHLDGDPRNNAPLNLAVVSGRDTPSMDRLVHLLTAEEWEDDAMRWTPDDTGEDG